MTLPDCTQFGPHDCAAHTPCQDHSAAGHKMLEAAEIRAGMGLSAGAEFFTDAGGSSARLNELTPITIDVFRRGLAKAGYTTTVRPLGEVSSC